jgi:hypothetical protein
MPETRRNPPIQVRILGSREDVPRVVTTLREVLDVLYTTPTYDADPPYEAHRYIGAAGLRGAGMPNVMAEISAAVKSWSRGNATADDTLTRIREQLACLE